MEQCEEHQMRLALVIQILCTLIGNVTKSYTLSFDATYQIQLIPREITSLGIFSLAFISYSQKTKFNTKHRYFHSLSAGS